MDFPVTVGHNGEQVRLNGLLKCLMRQLLTSMLNVNAPRRYFECGEPVQKYLTISYLADLPLAEWLASVGVSLAFLIICSFVAWMLHSASELARVPHLKSKASQPTREGVLGVTASCRYYARVSALIFSWCLVVGVLNSLTVVYLVGYSLPSNNRVHISASTVLGFLGCCVLAIDGILADLLFWERVEPSTYTSDLRTPLSESPIILDGSGEDSAPSAGVEMNAGFGSVIGGRTKRCWSMGGFLARTQRRRWAVMIVVAMNVGFIILCVFEMLGIAHFGLVFHARADVTEV